VDKSGVLDLEL